MKKALITIITILLVFISAVPALAGTASNESSARNSIYFYSQYLYTDIRFPDNGKNTLKDNGCGLFCYAHAYQKLSGEKKEYKNFLIDFAKLGDSSIKLDAYHNLLLSMGCESTSLSSTASEAAILEHFDKGGCAVVNIPGHYIWQ